eukprot:TRINITY_DN2300_c0_g1_i2.p1 TRINITY_DN2300_c0_g1~~TRINITY_DN2300_c0_g1_i2.p1  ORF type:complete len:230 (-),score=62.37 TRINITY_DN2300_c0_g1_i2:251-940(-)
MCVVIDFENLAASLKCTLLKTKYKKSTTAPVFVESDGNSFRIWNITHRSNVVVYVYDHVRLLPNAFVGSVNIDLDYVPINLPLVDWFPLVNHRAAVVGELMVYVHIHDNGALPLSQAGNTTNVDCISQTVCWATHATPTPTTPLAATGTGTATASNAQGDSLSDWLLLSGDEAVGHTHAHTPTPTPTHTHTTSTSKATGDSDDKDAQAQAQAERYASAFAYQPPPLLLL